MKNQSAMQLFIILSLLLLLHACGGGGGSDSTPATSSSAGSTDIGNGTTDNGGSSANPPVQPPTQDIPPVEVADFPETDGIDVAELVTGKPFFNSPHFNPILVSDNYVYVSNTANNSVDILALSNQQLVHSVAVGIEPVSLAMRPDGDELWVSNHVSDSVSVINTNPDEVTFHQVIATIQDFDSSTNSTRFDEPVGIAFADNQKAYVALSSTDKIAVIDVSTRRVTKRIQINAQDPRAIAVANGRLYVTPFESNNQTELSGCFGNIDGVSCTFSLQEHVVDNNNVLSLNYDADIVKDSRVPDRDLFVFDTQNESSLGVVSTLGTLLYGIDVTPGGEVFIAMTDARNHVNGRAGTQKHTLKEMGNRAFLNQVGRIDCSAANCRKSNAIQLEPLPPQNPMKSEAFATPYGVRVSEDNRLLFVTAAGSDKLAILNRETGAQLSQIETGSVPRGVDLQSNADGEPVAAWVYNIVDNSVSVINVSNTEAPLLEAVVQLDDAESETFKAGRALFNSARASSTGTFSCESCHPDGHTDQLLWVLGGPKCEVPGCTQIPVRSTMPVRGIKDTQPYHWDGVPGDPYGGRNGQFPNSNIAPNCTDELSCARNLVDGSLSGTMCFAENCATNSEGLLGAYSIEERELLANYILKIPYPPARERPVDNRMTARARTGFLDFFVVDPPAGTVAGQTCGSAGCHDMPLWTSTNIPGNGMEAVTFRGLPDRWLVLPQGRVNMVDLYGINGSRGFDERDMWLRIISGSSATHWQMFLEASMGYSGTFARQITLNQPALAGNPELINTMLDNFETGADSGAIIFAGEALILESANSQQGEVEQLTYYNGTYHGIRHDLSLTREELLQQIEAGLLYTTLTAQIGEAANVDNPQPLLFSTQSRSVITKIQFQRINSAQTELRLKGRYVEPNARLYVDGERVAGELRCEAGSLPLCNNEILTIRLETLPQDTGLHMLQIQNKLGKFSNEYLFFTE